MTTVFCDVIGRFLHVYLDDIFIFSSSSKEHEEHLGIVFEQLKKNHLYLKWAKCHPDADKL
jgi:hypothetical protein